MDRAGEVLRDSAKANIFEVTRAHDILSNWRASHSFPLNHFQVSLRRKARLIDPNALIAQRLKRASSAIYKLQALPTLRLSQMQDIGGCRAVVRSVEQVRSLYHEFLEWNAHHLLCEGNDYIGNPTPLGYRSLHVVYRYRSANNIAHDRQLIEIQIRTRIQHAWATAVETVSTFLRQQLKAGIGSPHWLRFFAMTSSALAVQEGTPPVPNMPTGRKLYSEIRRSFAALSVESKLRAYSVALETSKHFQHPDAHYYLLCLRADEKILEYSAYRRSELDLASREYEAMEKAYIDRPAVQTVLVRADSIEALKRAYPNFFLDTKSFLQSVANLINKP